MFGAKYYMRKALLNTNQNVKRLEVKYIIE